MPNRLHDGANIKNNQIDSICEGTRGVIDYGEGGGGGADAGASGDCAYCTPIYSELLHSHKQGRDDNTPHRHRV